MSVSAELIAGRYRLLRSLGSGGMGRVWLARDTMLHRDVAIKEVVFPPGLSGAEREELRRRTMREARAAARLSHPNVVQIYDILQNDAPSIVMEYVPSRSLQLLVRDEGPLPPRRVAEIGLAVLAALRAAHKAGVLHRDVKPGNVLIADDGRVVLSDFGLATIQGGEGVVTLPGSVLGSPDYIAPERAREGLSTPETDMWSLGATLYAAVEGRPPYRRETMVETLLALATTRPDPPRRAGPLEGVLSGLLRRNPRSRLSGADTEKLLAAVAQGAGTSRLRLLGRQVGWRGPALPAVAGADPEDDAFAPPPVADTDAVPDAATPRLDGPPGIERGISRSTAIALLLLTVLVAGLAAYGAQAVIVGHGPARHPSPSAPRTAAGPPTAVVLSTPGPGEEALPSGWGWYHDPSGYRLAAPYGWAYVTDGSTVSFREPDGGRSLALARLTPPADPMTDVTRADAGPGMPGYRRVRIESCLYFQACADREYTYDGPDGTRVHVLDREFTTAGGRAYRLSWRTGEFDWQLNQANFRLLTASFQPPR